MPRGHPKDQSPEAVARRQAARVAAGAKIAETMKKRWEDPEYRALVETRSAEAIAQAGPRSEESRERSRLATKRLWESEEYRQKVSSSLAGRKDGGDPAGYWVDKLGYVMLTMHRDHPLANAHGVVYEHRKVLHEQLGPGSHPCHWIDRYGCGREALEWISEDRDNRLTVDHLNWDRSDNRPENLAPACYSCNSRRQNRQNEEG
ncbi:putative HNH endonuclease [Rhodococcus phage E3]|uniref:HNH endonuclease n=1 Tax=Rhodococcus phage E3 TaxID=1007869 RepID=UPI0002C6BAB7|nr:HNH endonuclease [Rhodococcus phage E3]AEQ21068.1 putative HNH endonuclease [Rhodococcus phage E3]